MTIKMPIGATSITTLLLCVFSGYGQTQVDIRAQGRNFDFSGANSTKPLKTGTALPAQCNTGEMFFKTDAPAGQNVYGCTATNTWQAQAGSSGGAGGSVLYGTAAARPSTCSDGAMYYNTDLNSMSGCHPADTWGTVASGTSGSLLPAVTGVFPGSTATVGALCLGQGCGATFGATLCSFSDAPVFQVTVGTTATTGRIWINSSCQRVVNYDASLTIALGNGLTGDTVSTAFPADVLPVATFATSGTTITSVINMLYPKTTTLTSGAGPWMVSKTATGFQGTCPTCADTAAPNTFAGKQSMTPTSSAAGFNLGTLAGDPSPCTSGDMWFNSTTGKYRACNAGAPQDFATALTASATAAWPFGWPGNPGTVKLGGVSAIRYYQFFDLGPVGGSFNKAIFHTGGSDSGKVLTACIMNPTGSLLQQSSVVSLGSGTGKAAVTFSGGVTIKDGYWLGLLSDSTVLTVYAAFSDAGTDSMWNDYLTGESASVLPIVIGSNAATGSGASLSCPASIGTKAQPAANDTHYPTVVLLQ